MHKLVIGFVDFVITSPGGLEKNQREEFANSFLSELAERLSERSGVGFNFELEYAYDGCVRGRAVVALAMAAIAVGGVFLNYPDAIRAAAIVEADIHTRYQCRYNNRDWACRVKKCKFTLADDNGEVHWTKEGDSIQKIVEQDWQVAPSKSPGLIKFLKGQYRELIDPGTEKLTPGHPIVQLTPDMCTPAF